MIQYNTVMSPLITEKTTIQKEQYNKVFFEVEKTANRIEIKRAIENIFKVRVASVRTMRVKGKVKRKGQIQGKRKDWKKAIVTLMPGERITFFEGA